MKELEALAREIAACEGVPLPVAREIAVRQLATLDRYAQEWDQSVAAMSPAQPYRVSAA